MTALLQRRPRTLATPIPPAENRVILSGIDWPTYVTISDALPDRNIRITYDRGDMEIMTVSGIHDRLKSLVALLVAIAAEELGREVACFGSFTHRREDIERAIEPDSCFYIATVAAVLGKRNIDLEKDPPPDLAVEVEISRSLIDRLAILQALGVNEIWRLDEQRMRVSVLGASGYEEVAQSPSFPELSVREIPRFLDIGIARGDVVMMKEFRKWLRKSKKPKGKK
jgi:Uma2 family endonuclease